MIADHRTLAEPQPATPPGTGMALGARMAWLVLIALLAGFASESLVQVAILDYSFHLVQHAGHYVQNDQPEVVADLIKR